MKIKELFEDEQNTKENNLLGKIIFGKKITQNIDEIEWNEPFYCDSRNLTSLRYAPKKIKGDFNCSKNKNLSSLEFCPQEGVETFYSNKCDLTSLEGAPKKIQGNFYCGFNSNLGSLKGAPQEGVKDFYCDNCNLTSLEGAPKKIEGQFDCSSNKNLSSLKGMPQEGVLRVDCSGCNLTSLEGAPKKIGKNLNCLNNPIVSLKGIHKIIEEIDDKAFFPDTVESNILGLLKIRNLHTVKFVDKKMFYKKREIANIINSYLPNPSPSQIIDCQNELIDAGFEEYAEL